MDEAAEPLSEVTADSGPLLGGARWIGLKKFCDPRGALTPIEAGADIPFDIRRVFFFYDVPAGEKRGAHAHRVQEQVLICVSGSFEVLLDDGASTQSVRLSLPWRGLYLPSLLWASQLNFAGGTVGIVMASDHFDESDYIRDYDEFQRTLIAGR